MSEVTISKTKIDRAGAALAREVYRSDDEYLLADEVLDNYRAEHLLPLTETTSEIQSWLTNYDTQYYLAQRLKRKPQILRKLARLSVRLSQLQDIGGARIIVPRTADVDHLLRYIKSQIEKQDRLSIARITDYRELGRDRTGYRGLHVILRREGTALELQIRSRMQHTWAESIERTSIIYGFHLKEEEGDPLVVGYFRLLSEAFHSVESGSSVPTDLKIRIEQLRDEAEQIVRNSPNGAVMDSFVNAGIVKALADKQAASGITNWVIVFDWTSGSFVHWEGVSKDPTVAVAEYTRLESQFRAEDGFEVVLVGASTPSTLIETHSHYFGLDSSDSTLDTLDQSLAGFSQRQDLDIGARQILLALHRKHKWGVSRVSRDTIKNHYCANVLSVEDGLESLIARDLVVEKGGVSLNQARKAEIESYL